MKALSASQLKSFRHCPARWGFAYLDGEKEPDTSSTELGKLVHAELEEWMTHRKMPTNKIALMGLPYCPPRHDSTHVERPIHFFTPSSAWRGFVDLQYSMGEAIVIHDWKTTSSLQYALNEDTLLKDIQANLYVYEAFVQQGASRVHAKWVYLPTRGAAKAKEVSVLFDKQKTVDFVEGTLDKEGAEIQRLYQLRPKWQDLPKNTDACFAYGKRCPKYEVCPKPEKRLSVEGVNMSDFKAHMNAAFGGMPLPPPPPPFAPPPPPVALVVPPVPEAGFINPPEAPKVAAKSPEHAAQLQGIAPESEEEIEDEFTNLTRDQAKALCVSLGLVSAESRARIGTFQDLLRQHKKAPVVAPPAPVAAPAAPVQQSLDFAPPPVLEVPKAPEVVAYEPELDAGQEFEPPTRRGWTLYVDCMPLSGPDGRIYRMFSDLVSDANDMIRTNGGPSDYRLVEYGKGPGLFATAIADLLVDNDCDIVVLSSTPEVQACLTTLMGLADVVIKGV